MKRSAQVPRSWRVGSVPVPGPYPRRRSAWARLWQWLAPAVGWLMASRRRHLALLSVLGATLVLGGGWLWFQDSPLVGVQQVTVTGESGPDAGPIRSALVAAARGMTTLDVQTGQLYAAVSSFPVVKSLQVTTQFPHGMRIHVVEQLPVAVVTVNGRRIAVASDGTLLHDLARIPVLPRIQVTVPPGGPRLTEPAAVDALAAARAAPHTLLRRIIVIATTPTHGLVARLRNGPVVYLGDRSALARKWDAAVAVLANPGSVGASYIDVTDPRRPAAGVVSSTSGGGAGGTAGTSAGTFASTSASSAGSSSTTNSPATAGG